MAASPDDIYSMLNDAGVLIAAALCVVYERVKRKADFIIQTEKRQQSSTAFGQSAAECGDARKELLGLR